MPRVPTWRPISEISPSLIYEEVEGATPTVRKTVVSVPYKEILGIPMVGGRPPFTAKPTLVVDPYAPFYQLVAGEVGPYVPPPSNQVDIDGDTGETVVDEGAGPTFGLPFDWKWLLVGGLGLLVLWGLFKK